MKRKASVEDSAKRTRVCTTAPIDYSSVLPTQTAIESSQFVQYPCFTALPKDDETPIEFRIDRTDAFVDLNNVYLEIEIQVLKADGTQTEIDDKGNITKMYSVAPVNNIGNALFENVDLYLSDQKITNSDSTYPWWTYVYLLLYTNPLYKSNMLRGDCWYKDTAGLMDQWQLDTKKMPVPNYGHKERYGIFDNSAKTTLYTQVFLNKRFDRLIPPQTEVLLRFLRAPTNLSLFGDPATQYKIKVWDARLYVSRVKLYDHAMASYERLLNSRGFDYPLQSNITKIKTVSKGDQNVEWIPFSGKLPKRIYLWQISHEAYNAQIDKNMYNFQSFQINRLQVTKNGLSVPLSQGFTNIQDDNYLKLYYNSMKAINSPTTFDISKFDFNFGYLIVVIDLTNDGNAGAQDYNNPTDSGSVRVAIDYKNALPGSITLFCMGEFNEKLRIDKNRQVTWADLA